MHLMASVESIRQTKLLQEEQEQEQENEVSVSASFNLIHLLFVAFVSDPP